MHPDDLAALDAQGLVATARRIEHERDESLAASGRVLAELHDRCGLSWPQIARETGISQSTAFRRARPYLRRVD